MIDKNITDFYNTDFEDNYIVTCGHILGDSLSLAKSKTKGSGARGEYFNSGVIIFNLDKFRQNITIDSYKQACKELNYDFFLDQGLLNYMFADKAKYMPMLDYNFRFSVYDSLRDVIKKNNIHFSKSIIHYTLPKPHYKPWELYFTDEEIANLQNKKETSFFNISNEANDLVAIWWKYAKLLPSSIYRDFHKTMISQKKFFLRSVNTYGSIIMNQRNDLAKKYAYEEEQKKHIRTMQREEKMTYLRAFTSIYGKLSEFVFEEKSIFNDELNKQIADYMSAKQHLLILIVAKDNVSTYWNNIKWDKSRSGIDMSKCFRHAYIGILDNHHGFIYEKESSKEIEKIYDVAFNSIRLLSMGYDPKTMACCGKIVVNNYDLSLNQTGLNFVVINLDTNKIIDSFYVNLHSDPQLSVRRRI